MKTEITEEVAKLLKKRRYVNDPSEVPEGQQVQEGDRGGLYYETESESETDRSTETVSDIDFPDLGDSDFTARAEEITARMEATTDVEINDIQEMSEKGPSLHGKPIANYDFRTQNLYFDRERLMSEEVLAEATGDGFNAVEDDIEAREHIVRHEMIHAIHTQTIDAGHPTFVWDDDSHAKIAEREVSEYAAENAAEFVAEVGANLSRGNTYSDDVMDIYQHYGGPDVEAVV